MNLRDKLISGNLFLEREEEYLLENDVELQALYIEKIKSGCRFDIDYNPDFFGEQYNKDSEFFLAFLNQMYLEKPFNIYEVMLDFESSVSDNGFSPLAKSTMKTFFDSKKQDLLNALLNHPEDFRCVITGDEYIKFIIDNKIYSLSHRINPEVVTEEAERFVIEAAKNGGLSPNFVTYDILKYYENIGDLNQVAFSDYRAIIDDSRCIKIIRDSFVKGEIKIGGFGSIISSLKETDTEVKNTILKQKVENFYWLAEDEEYFFQTDELVEYFCDFIKKNKETDFSKDMYIMKFIENSSKIFCALLKFNPSYFQKIIGTYRGVDLIKRYYRENFQEFKDAFEYYLENYDNKKEQDFIGLMNVGCSEFAKLLAQYFDIEQILSIMNHYELNTAVSQIPTELYENICISATGIPKNYRNYILYPAFIYKAIVPTLSKEELIPENFREEAYSSTNSNIELREVFLKRLLELKSSAFNEHIDLMHTSYKDTVFSVDNPLNLEFNQIIAYIDIKDEKLLRKCIERYETISSKSIGWLLEFIKTHKSEVYTSVVKEMIKKLVMDTEALKKLQESLNSEHINSSNSILTSYLFEEKLKGMNNIPLGLSQYYPESIIQMSLTNISDEVFLSSPDYFKTKVELEESVKLHLKKLVEDRISSGKKISIKVFLSICNHLDFEFFKNHLLEDSISVSSDDLNTINEFIGSHVIPYEIRKEFMLKKWFPILKEEYKNNNFIMLSSLLEFHTKNLGNDLVQLFLDVINENSHVKLPLILLGNISKFEDEKKITQLLTKIVELDCLAYSDQLYNYVTTDNDNISTIIKNWINRSTLFSVNNVNQLIKANDTIFNAFIQRAKETGKVSIGIISEELLANEVRKRQVLELLEDKKIVINGVSELTPSVFNYEFLPQILKNYKKEFNYLIGFITHNLNVIYDERSIALINQEILSRFGFDKENYDAFFEVFGLETITLLSTKKFQEIMSLDNEKVRKLLSIIKPRQMTVAKVEAVVDSLGQNIFASRNNDIIELYPKLAVLTSEKLDDETLETYSQMLKDFIPETVGKMISFDSYAYDILFKDKEHFIRYVLLKSGTSKDYLSVLHEIVDFYIKCKRNEYRENMDIFEEADIRYIFDTKSLINVISSYMIEEYGTGLKQFINLSEEEQLAIEYLLDPTGFKTTRPELLKTAMSSISKLKNSIQKLVVNRYGLDKTQVNSDNFTTIFNNEQKLIERLKDVRKKVVFDETKMPITTHFSNINFETIINEILDDEVKYNCLLETLDKYSFLEWGKIFERMFKQLALGDDCELENFISYFNRIYDYEYEQTERKVKEYIALQKEKMKKEGKSDSEIKLFEENELTKVKVQFNPYKIFKYITLYSSIANCYKIILGLEDFNFVKLNPTDNAATKGSREQRLIDTAKKQIFMATLDEVTVPSFKNDYTVDENRSVRAIVGNRIDSRNLTHGERTGACMRSYGHANDLFTFCSTDKRGFHITFEDAKTGEYVSRISGFRNGNTVFLNQLRIPLRLIDKDELAEIMKSVAEELIERSKDSSMPIENVVASASYALDGHKMILCSNNNYGNGVYHGYTDLRSGVALLATIHKEKEVLPIKLNGDDQPVYKSTRLPIREYRKININEKTLIQRIDALKACISNDDPEFYNSIDLDPQIFENEFVLLYLGQDWYVAVDIEGKVIYNIIDPNNLEAVQELEEAKQKADEFILKNSVEGGFEFGGK